MAALRLVLEESDEVEKLVLRNAGMTDALLALMVPAVAGSRSEVKSINLNLNELSGGGAQSLVQLLKRKPCIQSLLLHGNQLGGDGIQTVMAGLSEMTLSAGPLLLSELDIGGNCLGEEGLRSVATYLRLNPPLTHLGLAHISAPAAWGALRDALKANSRLTHLILEGNGLGDAGAGEVAEVLRINRTLIAIDLDANQIGEEGGGAIAGSLAGITGAALTTISLENNAISQATMAAIHRSLTLYNGVPVLT